jgi:hypothetical protein
VEDYVAKARILKLNDALLLVYEKLCSIIKDKLASQCIRAGKFQQQYLALTNNQ